MGLLCALSCTAPPATAQQWTGSAGASVSSGYQTNPYLDPTLGTWDPSVDPAFAAFTPQLSLARRGDRLDVRATVRAQWSAGRGAGTAALPFAQASVAGRYALSPRWTAGLLAGGTRYRLASDRDTGWLLPSVRFTPTDGSRITLRAGVSQRAERAPSLTDVQTSALATLSGRTWLTDRLQGLLRIYRSNGRTGTTDVGFGGSGAEVRLSFWPASSLVVEGSAAVERLRYDTFTADGTPTEVTDLIVPGGVEARWQVRPSVTVFGHVRGLTADLGGTTASTRQTDVSVRAGVRVEVQRVLGGSAPSPPQRRLWTPVEDGLRFQVPYDGEGSLYVTGDFNGWALPGIPLSETEDDTWTADIDVPPGRYTYRLRVVTADGAHWMDFPPYAQTTDDAFGGTNGVCVAE